MILACAEPDICWGQRPCEGVAPSNLTCVSDGELAARRTLPGLGAAQKGSHAADLIPCSYGGQRFCWSEPKEYIHARQRVSSPAAASETPVITAISMDNRRGHLSGPRPVDVLAGVADAPFEALD